MDSVLGGPIVIAAAAMVVVILGVVIFVTRCFQSVAEGTALIVSSGGGPRVVFTRALVLPGIHTAQVLDLALHTLEISRCGGREGLGCRDNIRANVRAVFLIRVNRTHEDVLKVAQSVGCGRAGDPAALHELFDGKFTEALRTVACQLNFDELVRRRDEFKDQVIEVIGRDLNGFVLEDVAIESIEQTPIAELDPNNILDAEGIRKITEITMREQVKANELKRLMETELAQQNMVAAERLAMIGRMQAEAEARAAREVAEFEAAMRR